MNVLKGAVMTVLITACVAASAGATPALAAPSQVLVPSDVLVMDDFDPSNGVTVLDAPGEPTRDLGGIEKVSRIHSCEVWRNFSGNPGGYINSVPGCALIGTSKNTTVTYAWERVGNQGTLTIQGKGFNALRAPVWQNAGHGERGRTTILWGNVAATKQIRGFASTFHVRANWR